LAILFLVSLTASAVSAVKGHVLGQTVTAGAVLTLNPNERLSIPPNLMLTTSAAPVPTITTMKTVDQKNPSMTAMGTQISTVTLTTAVIAPNIQLFGKGKYPA
jgi:hypothetical protein